MNIKKTDNCNSSKLKSLLTNDTTKKMESKSQAGLKYPQCKNDKAFSSGFYKEPLQLNNN